MSKPKNENGIMPPPTGGAAGPGPSAAHLPCRPKAQELRAGLSSNSLRFLTTGRANGLIAFSSEWADCSTRWGLCSRFFEAVYFCKPHVLAAQRTMKKQSL
ncbi:hypothetical protein [Desulfocicer niacini]